MDNEYVNLHGFGTCIMIMILLIYVDDLILSHDNGYTYYIYIHYKLLNIVRRHVSLNSLFRVNKPLFIEQIFVTQHLV